MTDSMLLTQAAYDRLKDELEQLITVGRVEIAKRIQDAREEGDLKENGGYHAAKEEQGKIELASTALRRCWQLQPSVLQMHPTAS